MAGDARDSGPSVPAHGSVSAKAAANPAAHIHRVWLDDESPVVGNCELCKTREERIRALEAELRAARIDAEKERSLAEQATRARRTLKARITKLEKRVCPECNLADDHMLDCPRR